MLLLLPGLHHRHLHLRHQTNPAAPILHALPNRALPPQPNPVKPAGAALSDPAIPECEYRQGHRHHWRCDGVLGVLLVPDFDSFEVPGGAPGGGVVGQERGGAGGWGGWGG